MSVANISPILFEGVSMVTASPKHEIGTERNEGGVKYVLLYNAGGSSAAVGSPMSRPVSCAAGLYSCSASATAGDMVQGYVKHAAIPSGEYGWCVTRGPVTVTVASGASSQDAGPKACGAAAAGISTLAAGGFCVGELTTAIVSGNSGALFVNLR